MDLPFRFAASDGVVKCSEDRGKPGLTRASTIKAPVGPHAAHSVGIGA